MFRFFRAFMLCAVLLALVVPACVAETFELTILHTNDLHGMIQPFDYEDGQGYFGKKVTDVGGLARRATLIKQIRRETRHPVVVADVGDVFADGPWSGTLFGVPEIEAMNAMGYDLFGVGNNEFQATFGPDAKEKMLLLARRSRFPWLAANLTVADTGVPVEGIHPFVVREYNGVRVAFLGLIPDRVASYLWLTDWKTESAISAAARWVPLARKEADLVIVVAHLGTEAAEALIQQVPGIDAMIGGDSHSYTPTVRYFKSPAGNEAPYVQAGEFGVVLGRFDLMFTKDASWHLSTAKETLLPVTNELEADRKIQALLDRYLKPVPVALLVPAPVYLPA
jgi:5'-nucleotidase